MTENKLFDFQQVAVNTFSEVKAALLGDDMGLGKTVQAIALDKIRREKYRKEFQDKYKGKAMTLIVAPLSTLGGWVHHFKEWQPDLKVVLIDTKDRDSFIKAFQTGAGDVFICHWESLRLMPELKKVYWFNVVGDEIHRIKNRKAQMTIMLKQIPTAYKLGMSGTAADNRPDDFWSPLNYLFPDLFTSYWSFYNNHVIVKHHADGTQCCEKRHKRPYKEVLGTANVEQIHRAIEGRYLRRLKEDVYKELPDKYYTTIEVELSAPQRKAYEQMRLHMLAWIGEHENEPIAAPVVISQLVRLQQFACAYGEIRQVPRKNREGDTFVDNKLFLTDPSSKLDACMDLVEDNPDEPFVFFGQSKQVANLLAERLERANITTALLTGDTPAKTRTEIIDDFQAGRRRVFVGTIAAGGTGITLTRARTVVFIDRAWSPSWNRQAEDRLHRIGQKNAVQVIDLVATNTIDAERIQKIELKWSWLKEILGDKKVTP